MLLHQTPWDKTLHGLLSMRSSTELPSFCSMPSITQVASAVGWCYHFTKYWKYSCPLVFLNTFLSKIFSGCNSFAVGNCFTQSISCVYWSCAVSYTTLPSYLYRSATLKIGDIPTSGGNSISYAFAENFLSTLHGPIFFNFNLLCSLFWKSFLSEVC